RRLFIGEPDVEPVVALHAGEIVLRYLGTLGEALRAAVCGLARQQALQALEGIALHDPHLVGEVSLVTLELVLDDRLAALVALDAFASEHLHVDDRAADARRYTQ